MELHLTKISASVDRGKDSGHVEEDVRHSLNATESHLKTRPLELTWNQMAKFGLSI